MSYAIAESISAATGEVQWDATRNTWRLAESPATERVVIALRTQLGSCPTMPDLGVDWASVSKLSTDAPARADAAVRAGLRRYVDTGAITDLTVRVDVFPARNRMEYDVSFFDPRLSTTKRQRVQGRV